MVVLEPAVNKRDSLAQSYQQLEKRRLTNRIQEDYEAIINDCEEMNSILTKIEEVDKNLLAIHKKKAEDFKASTRWLIGWTSRHKAAQEITTLCDEITLLQSEALKISKQQKLLLVEQNNLYISYSRDKLSGDEFTVEKTAIDERLAPIGQELALKTAALAKKQGLINANSDFIGLD